MANSNNYLVMGSLCSTVVDFGTVQIHSVNCEDSH